MAQQNQQDSKNQQQAGRTSSTEVNSPSKSQKDFSSTQEKGSQERGSQWEDKDMQGQKSSMNRSEQPSEGTTRQTPSSSSSTTRK